MRRLSERELNRAGLARQCLLERAAAPLPRVLRLRPRRFRGPGETVLRRLAAADRRALEDEAEGLAAFHA